MSLDSAWMPDWMQLYFISYSVTFDLEIIKTDFFAGKKVEISRSVVDFVLLSILFEAEHNTAFL